MRRRGFTLIEVLVALAVLAIALAAAIEAVDAQVRSADHLRTRTLAHWVAMNQIAEMQVMNEFPPVGRQRGEETMGGHRWWWTRIVSDPGIEGIRQVIVEVRRQREQEDPDARLVALLGRPLR